ncbi:hypothetical protein C0995_014797, partial [Termitomyces sp. Mi166
YASKRPSTLSMFEARDAQLTASFSFKSRSAPTVKEVINEDCPEPLNPESIYQPILMDLKGEESVSTPLNSPSLQANPIPSYTTPLEQPPQPEDDTAQPQNDTIPLPTLSLTFSEPNITSSKPNITFLKPCSCLPLPSYSFPPNVPQDRYKGPHQPQSPSSTARLMPTKDAQNCPPPELFNGLDIRIIGTASFAQIIWEGAQAYQLHVSPSLPKEHLQADTNVPALKTKSEDQILHKVVPS